MTINVGTNSYVTLAEADAYFGERLNVVNWTDATDDIKERALIMATRFIDSKWEWVGTAVSSSQDLGWPRTGVTYYDETLGSVITIPDDETPLKVKIAVYEQALHLLNNEDVLSGTGRVFENISIGPISLTDRNSTSKVSKTASMIINLLKPLAYANSRVSSMAGSLWRAW